MNYKPAQSHARDLTVVRANLGFVVIVVRIGLEKSCHTP